MQRKASKKAAATAASILGSRGASDGGYARWKGTTKAERAEAMRAAVLVRWERYRAAKALEAKDKNKT